MQTSKQAKAQSLCDYAITLIHKGQQNEAYVILTSLQRTHPELKEPLFAIIDLSLNSWMHISDNELMAWVEKLKKPSLQDDPVAFYLRAKFAESKNELDVAERLLTKSISIKHDFNLAIQQLGCIKLKKNQWNEAEIIFRKQLTCEPKMAHLLVNLATALMRQNKLEEAYDLAKSALKNALQEQKASIHVNIGTIQQERGHRDDAQYHYNKALKHDPNNINACLNLGVIALQNKDLIRAEQFFRETLNRRPHDAIASVNLAGILLLQDRTQEGWSYYESRLQKGADIFNPPCQLKRWHGGALNEALVLVHEQGLGDTFQFIRYAITLKKMGIKCYFRGPKKLFKVIQESNLVCNCFSESEPLPDDAKRWVALMSLPLILHTEESNMINFNKSYLIAHPKRIVKWQSILEPKRALRVALHWQGNLDHEFTISRGRSFAVKELSPLFELQEVDWISLQKGPGSEQALIDGISNQWHPNQSKIDNSWGFEDAAAILKCCDVLISSDSGLAHLAGGLGVHVWLLLPWLAEWRWGWNGCTSSWYKNHRLYRQTQEGSWENVVREVQHDLRIKIATSSNKH